MKRTAAILIIVVLGCLSLTVDLTVRPGTPDHFPAPVYEYAKNPSTEAGVLLGQALFYDPILSRDSSVSCASCHSPYNAFAHTDHDLSHGIDDQIGLRNAPGLWNLAWRKDFMWDGSIDHLDMQPLAPISDEKEMDFSMKELVVRLQRSERYRGLFAKAFADSVATGEHTLKAMAQFQVSLVSAGAKYDQVKTGLDTFTLQEAKGYALFQQHCNSCHTEPLFSNDSFANNGLPVDTTLNDWGRLPITRRSQDSLLFRVPSLRNLAYTFPYMHDGRFNKLRHVLNHYTSGIANSATLDRRLQQPLPLTDHDKSDLLAFLRTLNDRDFVFDRSHGFPKKILMPAQD